MTYEDNLVTIQFKGNTINVPKFIAAYEIGQYPNLFFLPSVNTHINNTITEDGFTFCINNMNSLSCNIDAGCHINGIQLDIDEFGDTYDKSNYEDAPDYGCGNRRFEIGNPTQEVLNKYGITYEQWFKVASILEYKLSVGRCNQCA
jgi:hypothetical protein